MISEEDEAAIGTDGSWIGSTAVMTDAGVDTRARKRKEASKVRPGHP